jgi:small subunit ribosomal protein S2
MDKKQRKTQKWKYASYHNLKVGSNLGNKSLYLSKTKFWHPLMSNYILGVRNGVSIINTQQTKQYMLKAFYMIALILRKKGHVLVINTNPEFSRICKNFSILTLQNKTNFIYKNYDKYNHLKSSSISYCCYKWIGGTLTNWKQVSKAIYTFAKFSERCESFLIQNNIEFPKYQKVKDCFEGLLTNKNGKIFLTFSEKPDLIFLMNPNENRNIINEANHLSIPIIAFAESNTNLIGISYPIPINNYSIDVIYYCLKKIVQISLISTKQI